MAALRHRQEGGIPLTKGQSFVVTLVLALCVPVIGYLFWFPLFGIPEEMRKWLALFGFFAYIAQCVGFVPTGVERAQKFFGMYTGESFPAGIYLSPRIPFPVISFFIWMFTSEQTYQYLGWFLEGDVSIESITISFFAEGLTSNGIRVRTEGSMVFEVVRAATFLSQKWDGPNRVSLEQALRAEVAARIKQRVIAEHTAKDLYQGNTSTATLLNQWITDVCLFEEDFGVKLSRSPIVTITILNERVQRAFDVDAAKDLFRDNTNEVAAAFREFYKGLPENTSQEVAFMLFNAARIDEGQSPIDYNVFKFK